MGYIEGNLISGEKVVYRTHLHWVMFIPSALWMLLGIAGFVIHPIVGEIVLAIGLISFLFAYIRYSSAEYGVTNKRVLIKVGVIGRHSLEILLPKVEGVVVDQSIWGRIFGYGTIVIIGVGGTREPFPGIAAPFAFRRQIQEQIANPQ